MLLKLFCDTIPLFDNKNMKKEKGIVVYQTKSGAIEFREDLSAETIWATQSQIAQLFDIDQSVVSRHIKSIFNEEEVDRKSNMHEMHIANSKLPSAYAGGFAEVRLKSINIFDVDVVFMIHFCHDSKGYNYSIKSL